MWELKLRDLEKYTLRYLYSLVSIKTSPTNAHSLLWSIRLPITITLDLPELSLRFHLVAESAVIFRKAYRSAFDFPRRTLLSANDRELMTVNYKNIRKREIHIIVHINVWRKSVFDIYFTEFGADLATVLPVLFKYCCKYCYSDSRKLWAVMKGGGLAL